MSPSHGLDIRIPIGVLFTMLGLLLAGYGVATGGQPALYAQSLSVNLNLWWGLVMLLFGIILLSAAQYGRRPASPEPAMESREGRAIEAREHEGGLEH